jgi:hypothetical protein
MLCNPSTPEGVDDAHTRRERNRNNNTADLDALHQLEMGRGNQTRLVDGDPGPSRSAQGSARYGGVDVEIGFAIGKPTGVARGTTQLSSKLNQEAVQ